MTKKQKEILNLISAIRGSFPDASIIYTFGGCYGFYEILKSVFKDATPYMLKDETHIITKIGDSYYDITGEYIDVNGEARHECTQLNERQKRFWESVASGQRAEWMLKKYND